MQAKPVENRRAGHLAAAAIIRDRRFSRLIKEENMPSARMFLAATALAALLATAPAFSDYVGMGSHGGSAAARDGGGGGGNGGGNGNGGGHGDGGAAGHGNAGGNGIGRGDGLNDSAGPARGAANHGRSDSHSRASAAGLGPLNAAHASARARSRAAPNSAVGKIATYDRERQAALSMINPAQQAAALASAISKLGASFGRTLTTAQVNQVNALLDQRR
jgi:hypothetical protein